ncbi:MAG: hypothetical protein ACI92E_002343, partial [Oceanicoccus sp.]
MTGVIANTLELLSFITGQSIMPKRFLSKVHLPLIMLAIVLSGCDNKWENMPDDELAAKSTDCYGDSLSTAMIQVCKNY